MPRAPKRCGRDGCTELVTGRTYCPVHTVPWANSTGHKRTTSTQWKRTRSRVLNRDQRICYVCGQPGADTVDHVVPVADGGSEDDSNLAAIHDNPCHRRKTASEGHAAARLART